MNQNLHTPTKLTEFSRDFDTEPETFFNKFVSKLTTVYNVGFNTVNPTTECNSIIHTVPSSSSCGSLFPQTQTNQPVDDVCIVESQSSTTPSSASSAGNVQLEGNNDKVSDADFDLTTKERTPLNVIQRISSLISLKETNGTSYRDTELQRFWMPDSKSRECYDCTQKFTTFRRKHHCRLCGQIFCSRCCSQVVPGKIIKCSGDLKVCTYCSKIVLSYLKSPDINSDLKSDLQALQEHLTNKLDGEDGRTDQEIDTGSKVHRKISVGYQEERFVPNPKTSSSPLSAVDRKNILQQSKSLKSLFNELSTTLPNQIYGSRLIDFMIDNHKSSNQIQAKAILIALIQAGFLIPEFQSPDVDDSDSIVFDESTQYRLLKFHEPLQHSSSFDLESTSNPLRLSRTSFSEEKSINRMIFDGSDSNITENSLNFQTTRDFELQNSLLSTAGSRSLMESFCNHEEALLTQLLRTNQLDQCWSKYLLPLCARVTNSMRPELCGIDMMDIRNYVNFKKVSGGNRNECFIVGGVVFSKNVIHKDMATRIEKPRVLLLKCAIVYQRIEGKFVSIETLLLQEKEYLQNVTARILNLKCNIVLVHKNVSGIAQDMLRNNDITVVLDVKLSVLERLSRCLDCDIVTSIDSNIGRPKLGSCEQFYIRKFADHTTGLMKTLMFFEVPASTRGCCVLLRGGTVSELHRVKRVAQSLLYARYNWRLELSFLLDEFARPPSPKPSIFDSKDHSPANENSAKPDDELRAKESKSKDVKYEKCVVTKVVDVPDFSDPLRAESDFVSENSVNFAVESPYDNRFRTALSSTVLSVSPFNLFPLPYLETESGRKCSLRKYFPKELYYSKQWTDSVERSHSTTDPIEVESKTVPFGEKHEFVTHKITHSIDSKDMQSMLANFRAAGSRLTKVRTMQILTKPITKPPEPIQSDRYKDVLEFENHQQLPVLFCSYYYNLKAPSSFCAPPALLTMTFYGRNDIMLGEFLERYCFRSSYICQLCNLPMLDHIRRYVHSMGCVQVKLSEDCEYKKTNEPTNQILMTSWCTVCHERTPSVPMSQDTWCYSFAKYLELRFHGHAYKQRNVDGGNEAPDSTDKPHCSHSLHRDHIQYFSFNGMIASFVFTPIESWSIQLPIQVLTLKTANPIDSKQVLEDIKLFAQRGYDVFQRIHDKIQAISGDCEATSLAALKQIIGRDQQIFRDRVSVVQTHLSEPLSDTVDINRAMYMVQRALAESIEQWAPRLQDVLLQSKNSSIAVTATKTDPVTIDTGTVCTEDYKSDTEKIQSDPGSDIEQVAVVDRPKEMIDKKSVKTILRDLIPSDKSATNLQSPLSHHEHFCLPIGEFPVVVHDQDLSSIIAYSLTSNEYKRLFEGMVTGSLRDHSPYYKRKPLDTESGDENGSSEKKSKPNHQQSHLDFNFQDSTTQFTCKFYFAQEFDALRSNFLLPPELGELAAGDHESIDPNPNRMSSSLTATGSDLKDLIQQQRTDQIRIAFARSLTCSVQWEARGGKSGSKFCKTLDDRFVLKEMSKQDVGIFESFAPNYFIYLNQCLQKGQPTLLAKIFGVFKISIKKKDFVHEKSVLVMENLFYDREINNKFDLKGSIRNRLVNPTNQIGEIVLLDENLIQMSWSKPLYILPHSKTILKDAIHRDATFLEKNDVMDYSLLVGLNTTNKFLVLGIIDYIRTFTLDKRIESLVKQTGFLGGQGKLPTVVSPKLYRHRFSEAMDRYFLTVPDRWEGFATH